jgi:hypothetical protein
VKNRFVTNNPLLLENKKTAKNIKNFLRELSFQSEAIKCCSFLIPQKFLSMKGSSNCLKHSGHLKRKQIANFYSTKKGC